MWNWLMQLGLAWQITIFAVPCILFATQLFLRYRVFRKLPKGYVHPAMKALRIIFVVVGTIYFLVGGFGYMPIKPFVQFFLLFLVAMTCIAIALAIHTKQQLRREDP